MRTAGCRGGRWPARCSRGRRGRSGWSCIRRRAATGRGWRGRLRRWRSGPRGSASCRTACCAAGGVGVGGLVPDEGLEDEGLIPVAVSVERDGALGVTSVFEAGLHDVRASGIRPLVLGVFEVAAVDVLAFVGCGVADGSAFGVLADTFGADRVQSGVVAVVDDVHRLVSCFWLRAWVT